MVGTSTHSIEEPVQNAIAGASQSVHGMRWFEVVEIRGNLNEGKVDHWQVTVKIGFTLDA
ncbi:dodecin [Stieleria neptunia]|uniref:dodecin n=1 Tax=Stieleria neptunia TaxID=2527979 RepID=UPI0011A3CC3E|nr:dodecin [Stieleria neptunia]